VVTNDNISIIVLNSSFISGKAVHWSHGDPKVRLAEGNGGVIAATGMILHLKVVPHRVEFGVLQRPDPSSIGMLIAITSAARSEAPVEAIAPATGIKAPNSTITGQSTSPA
jgi:hypothetical protein